MLYFVLFLISPVVCAFIVLAALKLRYKSLRSGDICTYVLEAIDAGLENCNRKNKEKRITELNQELTTLKSKIL